MRIIAGEWKGRRITAPKGMTVRPTPERVREAWMSILQNDLPDALVLDLCSGTGALGLEALSRGAALCDFVERDARSRRALEENIRALGAGPRSSVHAADAIEFVAHLVAPAAPFGATSPVRPVRNHVSRVCFADPPYRTGVAGKLATLWLAAPFSTILGVEHESSETLPEGGDRRHYGDTAITIYRI